MTTLVLLARAARTWLVAAGRSLDSRRFGCWVRHLRVSKHTGSLLRMPLLADGFQVFCRPVEVLRLRPRDPGQAREEQHEAFPGRYERRRRVDGFKGGPDPSKFDGPVDVGVSAGILNKRTLVRGPKVDP